MSDFNRDNDIEFSNEFYEDVNSKNGLIITLIIIIIMLLLVIVYLLFFRDNKCNNKENSIAKNETINENITENITIPKYTIETINELMDKYKYNKYGNDIYTLDDSIDFILSKTKSVSIVSCDEIKDNTNYELFDINACNSSYDEHELYLYNDLLKIEKELFNKDLNIEKTYLEGIYANIYLYLEKYDGYAYYASFGGGTGPKITDEVKSINEEIDKLYVEFTRSYYNENSIDIDYTENYKYEFRLNDNNYYLYNISKLN